MQIEFWKIAVPSVIALIVAVWSHQTAVRRQLHEYRRKQRTEYLISAFRSLMINSSNDNLKEAVPALRDAAILIQIMGTQEQFDMLKTIIDKMKNHESAPLDPLLESLRDDLRKELEIEKISSPIFWIHPKSDAQ